MFTINDISSTNSSANILIIQISAVVIWLSLVFLASEILRRLNQDSELVRKVVHIGTGNVLRSHGGYIFLHGYV